MRSQTTATAVAEVAVAATYAADRATKYITQDPLSSLTISISLYMLSM
jgi:hypothetical protein